MIGTWVPSQGLVLFLAQGTLQLHLFCSWSWLPDLSIVPGPSAWRMLHRAEWRMVSRYPAFQGVPSWNLNFLTPWSDPISTECTRVCGFIYYTTASHAARLFPVHGGLLQKPLSVSRARQGPHQQRAIWTSAFSASNPKCTGLTGLPDKVFFS